MSICKLMFKTLSGTVPFRGVTIALATCSDSLQDLLASKIQLPCLIAGEVPSHALVGL